MSHSCCQDHTGESYSIYRHIDIDNVICFNETTKHSIKKVFKHYDDRANRDEFVESYADEQLIVFIPFSGYVKLKSLCVIGGEEGKCPSKVKIFANNEGIDFSNVEDLQPIQVVDLLEDPNGELDHPLKVFKLNNLSNITLYFPENFGDKKTVLYYIGLKGEYLSAKRRPVVTNYELAPNPAKNKNANEDVGFRSII